MKHWMLGMMITLGLGISVLAKEPEQPVDWPAFLAQNDLVWTNGIPDTWGECAFIANGLTGASIYRLPGEEWVLRWELGRTDVAAEYVLPKVDWTMPRVPIGNVLLKPRGDVKKATMRMDIWNAEARGTIETSKGVIRWRSFIERETNVLVIDLQATGGERGVVPEMKEQWGISPRIIDSHTPISEIDPDLLPPKPYRKKMGDTTVVVQPLLKTGAHATAFKAVRGRQGSTRFLLSIGKFYEANVSREKSIEKAKDEAVGALRKAQAENAKNLTKRHRAWWHNYLKQAWINLPNDPQWEQFYWLQIYKFGAASRADYPIVMDNVGPWFTQVGWPGTWWNMNVETAYQLQFSGNRMEVGRVLVNTLDHFFKTGRLNSRKIPDAICLTRSTGYNMLNAPGSTYELGNMAWTLHSYWKYWRYSMDNQVGRNLFPMLKANINYYLGVMERDDQGRIHLPPSVSPEYSNDRFKDTNYSLQTFDWLLRTALDFNQRFHFDDPAAKTWQDALDHLRRFPALPAPHHQPRHGRRCRRDIQEIGRPLVEHAPVFAGLFLHRRRVHVCHPRRRRYRPGKTRSDAREQLPLWPAPSPQQNGRNVEHHVSRRGRPRD